MSQSPTTSEQSPILLTTPLLSQINSVPTTNVASFTSSPSHNFATPIFEIKQLTSPFRPLTHVLDTRPNPTSMMNDAAESLENRKSPIRPQNNQNQNQLNQIKSLKNQDLPVNDKEKQKLKPFPFKPSKDPPLNELDASLDNSNLEETVIIPATPANSQYTDEVAIEIARADAVYNLSPIHCGKGVVFLNAHDPRFYKRELLNPSLTVWVLSQLSIEKSHALKRMFESAWRQNIQLKVMEVDKFELIASQEGLETILYEGAPVELPDCIFNRVGANVSYFGMAVIRQLENMQCLIFNNLKSIEISRDKMMTVQILSSHGLPIPKSCLAKFPINLETIQREFTFPIIIKKVSGSQGKGIIRVDNSEQLKDLIDMLDVNSPLIFQEYIKASVGRDLRVFVIGGRVVGAMMRIAKNGNFKANIHQGGISKPVKVSPQVEWLVLETVKIIGLDIAGVDLLIDHDSYKICEVNSSPGFEGLEAATGENIAIKMLQYMKMRLGVWRRNMKKGDKRNFVNVPIDSTSNTGDSDVPQENANTTEQNPNDQNNQLANGEFNNQNQIQPIYSNENAQSSNIEEKSQILLKNQFSQ